MDKDRIHLLIAKYIDGTASAAEQEELNNWYRQKNELEDWQYLAPADEEQVGKEIGQHLNRHLSGGRKKRIPLYVSLAAACLTLIVISTWWLSRNKPAIQVAASSQTSENKFVILPDSSIVILHAGSRIAYQDAGKTRELQLEGEAYFDIRHRTEQPFIIHTGRIQTTVMGTTFNIKAYSPDSVTVSVISGSVKVTDAKNNSAILSPNQEVVYNVSTNLKKQEQTLMAGTIAWTKADMQFQDMPYGQLAERLSRRYDVDILFKNRALENCLITGRFSGRETLREVLEILSQTMGTTYEIKDRTVELDGTGCL
jgi:ferric-dicitrate binding protein FerR (iron transport regulator)